MTALWVIAGAILLLVAVIARGLWIWATTSNLDRPLSEREVAELQRTQTTVLAAPLYPPINGNGDEAA
jgi:hypothetical protein